LRSAVFQNRRVNELIHSLGNGIMQPLQAVHAVFLAALRKALALGKIGPVRLGWIEQC
jgi:hypothetical protein